jgi:mono/diheme cytochrome c family protein
MRYVFIAVVLAAGTGVASADPPKIDPSKLPAAAAGKIDFQRDIEPIFKRACVTCHGAEKQRGDLRLDDGEHARQGSNAGPVLVAGKAVESRLLHVVAGLDPEVKMPPKEKPPLTPAEIGKLRAWIDQGAVWPKSSATIAAARSDHWAFQLVKKPAIPAVKQTAWVRNPIDAFVLARLEKENIAPSPEAERVTLIRRLCLDLLGLPPSPQEVDAFLADTSADAYEKLVERLLASPHYGERWGRHWLDLARYGDSDGFEQDRPRPFAWRYRQWVIEAFNRDIPFNQFTIEQLAGDLLENATVAQKTATGFHRNTLTNREGGTDKEQFRVEACVDRVNTTAKVYLGMTLGCAQCHDHKYDPFSQREYYQLFAFFNGDNEVDLTAPLPGEQEAFDKAKPAFDQKKKELQDAIAAHKKGLTAEQVKSDKKLVELNKMLTEHEKTLPALSVVPTLAAGAERKSHVLLRGDFLRPGAPVQAGMPRAIGPAPAAGAGLTRLDLARWLLSDHNPLTSRVIVNWVWHKYFGRGLVATLEDFGTQGEKPFHPELLDYLATEFKARKWGMKELHKLIVTSAAYRQSSKVRPELTTRDPLNLMLARQSRWRVEAEIIRDSSLAVSGLLNRTIGGPSVKPPQPPGISELTYANTARWVESKGPDRYRRAMYTWFQRTSPYPMLMNFDSPDGVLSCVRREKSNTPLQSLTLLNERPFVEGAQALAKRVLTEQTSTKDRLDYCFRICVARRPTDREFEVLDRILNSMLVETQKNPTVAAKLVGEHAVPGVPPAESAAWVALARAIMNLDEFVTRE